MVLPFRENIYIETTYISPFGRRAHCWARLEIVCLFQDTICMRQVNNQMDNTAAFKIC